MKKQRTTQELFEAIFRPYGLEIEAEEIVLLREKAEAGEALAELCLILLDFYYSTMHYNFFNGSKDELDEVQVATFAKLEALGKKLPLAYRVAGDLYLGKMGKIVWHSDVALEYFKKYASASGDTSIVDGYEEYTREAWEAYKSVQNRQQTIAIREAFKGLQPTYSHDPLFYENLKDDD